MSELEGRLLRCFASVFPSVAAEELPNLSVDSTGVWDSLATVTLAAVIEEECRIAIDPDVLPDLTSYTAFLQYLEKQHSL
jgi:acyl carrier protein